MRILASISRAVIDPDGRAALPNATGLGDALAVLAANASQVVRSPGSRTPPALAGL